MKKFIALDVDTGDSKFFDTTDDAKTWLDELWEEGTSLEGVNESLIAEVKIRGNAKIADKISNYKCNYDGHPCDMTGPCLRDDTHPCGGSDEWPHYSGFDEVLTINFEDFINEN